MKKTKSCRWCKFASEWEYSSNGRILSDYGAPCKWTWPKFALPDSLRLSPFFSLPEPGWVSPNDGKNCSTFEWKEEEPNNG